MKNDKFTIRPTSKCIYIRCLHCNQSHSFCGKDVDAQIENFKRDHAHEPKTIDKGRLVNSLIGKFGE